VPTHALFESELERRPETSVGGKEPLEFVHKPLDLPGAEYQRRSFAEGLRETGGLAEFVRCRDDDGRPNLNSIVRFFDVLLSLPAVWQFALEKQSRLGLV